MATSIDKILSFDIGELRREIQDVDVRTGAAEIRVTRMIERLKIAQNQIRETELVSNKLEGFLTKNVAKGLAIGAITSGAGALIDGSLTGDAKEIASAATNIAAAATFGASTGQPAAVIAAVAITTVNELRQIQARHSELLAASAKAGALLQKRLDEFAKDAKRQREDDVEDRRKLRLEVLEIVRRRGEKFLDEASRYLGAGDEF